MVSVALQWPGRAAVEAPRMPEPVDIALRVSGGKPLRATGVLMAEATSWSPSVSAWHEVALYRCDRDECAASVRMLKKAVGETDIHHAELFTTIGDALNWLEAFDPTADLAPDFDAADRRVNTVEIALRSAALRQDADAITRQWRGLLGELLYRFARLD